MSFLKLGKDTETGLGHSKLWFIPNHVFTPAAINHDKAYDLFSTEENLKKADEVFLAECLEIASHFAGWRKRYYQIQAYLFFGIVTTFRILFR